MTTQKYDGCSGGQSRRWRKLFGIAPPWESCCDTHDAAYAKGGTREERMAADMVLFECVKSNGYPVTAQAMWAAVRLGGGPWTGLPWRWGFATDKRAYTHD